MIVVADTSPLTNLHAIGRLSLLLMGLLGVLLVAKRRGVVSSVREVVDQLRSETSFRMSEDLVQRILTAAGEPD